MLTPPLRDRSPEGTRETGYRLEFHGDQTVSQMLFLIAGPRLWRSTLLWLQLRPTGHADLGGCLPQQLSIQTFDSDLARACDRMLSSLHVDSNTGGNAVAPLLDPAFEVDLRMGSLGYCFQWTAPIGRPRCLPRTGAAPSFRWSPRFFKLIGDGLQILWGEPVALQTKKNMDSCTKSFGNLW